MTAVPPPTAPKEPLWRSPLFTGGSIILLAVALRFALLGIKPPHFDEGVNGWFVDQMTQQGYYHYDPSNFHGPLHFYVLFVSQTLLGRDIWALRLPIALVSTACVAVMLGFSAFFGRRQCEIAAFAAAISPGLVFYGRYSIHESWLLLFLLITAWGALGMWRFGRTVHLWTFAGGITGMILIKETYAIHLMGLALAIPTLLAFEKFSPSSPCPFAVQQWNRRDLGVIAGICAAGIVFFYSGGLLDWPDFSREPGSAGSVAGLWETFGKWASTGTAGESGHEKPWAYWLELFVRYEWPAAAGLLATPFLLFPQQNRALRYLCIAGVGTLVGYSIIEYKTPWCLIVILWPFLFMLGQALITGIRAIDRPSTWALALLLFGMSGLTALKLNFIAYTDEREPFVYVQSLEDVNGLTDRLQALTRISPHYYHIRGNILIQESDTHPLPWLLGDFTRVQFLDKDRPPDEVDADFLLVEDSIVSDVEERLKGRYYKEDFDLRGGWGTAATLYLSHAMFGPFMGERSPEFVPAPPEPPAPTTTEEEEQ